MEKIILKGDNMLAMSLNGFEWVGIGWNGFEKGWNSLEQVGMVQNSMKYARMQWNGWNELELPIFCWNG